MITVFAFFYYKRKKFVFPKTKIDEEEEDDDDEQDVGELYTDVTHTHTLTTTQTKSAQHLEHVPHAGWSGRLMAGRRGEDRQAPAE